jgi:hypothetical protein
MLKKNIVVYWASEDGIFLEQPNDWSMLYTEPISLEKDLNKNIVPGSSPNFFQCPSVRNILKNTFVLKNPIESKYSINSENEISSRAKNSLAVSVIHQPTLKGSFLFQFALGLYFFSEEDLTMTLSAPFFSQADHMRYGAVVPGSINIGSWFRNINFEFNLWEGVKEFSIKENEPMAYVRFETEKNVVLKRFKMNKNLTNIGKTCSTSSTWEKGVPLSKRYARFKNSKTNKYVLQEIQRQLIDE